MANQNPEQIARDVIDNQLVECGWVVQNKNDINLHVGSGIAVREYQTNVGPADYVLFVDKKAVGIIEAKRPEEGVHLSSVVQEQSHEYATSKLKHLKNDPLPFVYESTGEVTRFTDRRDPKPRSRRVFTFHRPETLSHWLKEEKTQRGRFADIPSLNRDGLRECQIRAISNLETSFREYRPKALIQMATGSGKTFTAITFIYRLLKYARAKKVLFLVDTKNLGEQAEQEFMSFVPNDDNRKFSELYGVHRLKSGYVPIDNQVYISTIQRFYSLLKGEDLDESSEETNPGEIAWNDKRAPVPVAYNTKVPIEFFDFVVIDECHRSIYNLWKQVLDYFDSFLVGLTATPDSRTFGFFDQNVVSEYTHEQAVTDGVNVGFDVYQIETEVTKKGGVVWKGEYVDTREKLTRDKRWVQLDEDEKYSDKQLDDKVVNPNQIRLILKTFKEHLPEMFPERYDADGRFEVPKSLIFAKTDSHADDIIQMVREEFAEENSFCKKITYGSDDPKGTLAQFRNDYYPRIAVTVDMIATGTDVKSLECLLFMRDVKSRNYFEQMKGRGTRTIELDDLRKVTPTAQATKDHFVIVDAIGVTKSLKTDSRPLEKKPGVSLKDLLGAIAVGVKDEDLFTSLAGRLARLAHQMTEREQSLFTERTGGKPISDVVKGLLNAYDPDVLADLRTQIEEKYPDSDSAVHDAKFAMESTDLQDKAASVFNGELNTLIDNIRKTHNQIIDHITPDLLTNVGWDKTHAIKANEVLQDFAAWMEQNKDEITALQIFYNQPYLRRNLTYSMIRELNERLRLDRPQLAPLNVWRAYEQLGNKNGTPKSELIALVSLVRNTCGMDKALVPFDKTVDRNFQEWVFKKQAGSGPKFSEAQMQWLRMIKDYVASSFHIGADDFDLSPFNAKGGLVGFYQAFKEDYESVLDELNEALVA